VADADLTTIDFVRTHALEIERAARRIAPYVRRTPLLRVDLDPRLRIKPECLQVTGSFKVRGAFNALLQVGRRPEAGGVAAVSSGNHAQAVALAARTAGVRAVIVIPQDANPAKVAATRAFGADVVQDGVTFANREDRALEVVERQRLQLVHPFDDWDVIHGQATAAREALEDDPEIGALVAPVGGGGLLSGTALAAKGQARGVAVVGVEPERADDAARSWAMRRRQRLAAPPDTMADGVRTVALGSRSFEVLVERGLADAIVTVSEDELAEATRRAWLDLKLAVEPSGALPLAAFLCGRLDPWLRDGRSLGLILSGGNADPALMARLLASR
jgi:threonine dehydratase